MDAYKKILFSYFAMFFLVSCASDSTIERIDRYEKSLASKDCEQVDLEIRYQESIAKGLKGRQDQQLEIGDLGAAALTLGYNVIEGSVRRSTRDSRIEEVESKLEIAQLSKEKKGCKV